MFGPSGVFFGGLSPNSSPAVVVTGADDGLSTAVVGAGLNARLGQLTGQAGEPGQLLENREIPMKGKRISFVVGTFPVYNSILAIDGNQIDIFNDGTVNAGQVFHAFDGVNNLSMTLFNQLWQIDTGDGNLFGYNYVSREWSSLGSIISGGGIGSSFTIVPAGGTYNMVITDAMILCNVAGLTATVNINPALFVNRYFNMRSVGSSGSFNLVAPSAVIFNDSTNVPVSTLNVGANGAMIFFCDGTNIYQLSRL